MSALLLRPARSTDAGKTAAILSRFIDDTDWLPRIHTRAEDVSFTADMIDRGWVTVAERDGAVIGFSARNGETVHALYVDTGSQGRGCGSQLLIAMQKAVPKLTLWTFQVNTRAQSFYARHGFAEVERTDGARNDEGLPDMRLVWNRETS